MTMKNLMGSFLFGMGLCVVPLQASLSPVGGSLAPIIKQAAPAVVNIRVIHDQVVVNPFANDPAFSFFFGDEFGVPKKLRQESAGSGNIVRKDGIILTCAHVIKGGQKISVKLPDGRNFDAKLLHMDEKNDIALVKITNLPKNEELPVVAIGRSEDLEVGDLLIAIGYPFGIKQTVTAGIVSAKDQQFMDRTVLQTDASVNPGNSGGALINAKGELMALPNAIVSRSGASHGIGFGIPAPIFRTLVKNIDNEGKIHKPWHGYDVATVESRFNDKEDKGDGVVVRRMHPKSPAVKAGLTQGDIITHVGGRPITSAMEFNSILEMTDLGEKVILKVLQGDKPKDISYTPEDIAHYKEASSAQVTSIDNGPLKGLKVTDRDGFFDPTVMEESSTDTKNGGVTVVEITPGSPVVTFRFQKGDVLLSLNGVNLRTVEDLKKVQFGRKLSIQLKRGDALISMTNSGF